ncbi:MAG TPA: riboflavin synthase [Vicinamibacteria bacterium]|nr:riboflavin synthase [Vicinamibacteria bacterium]
MFTGIVEEAGTIDRVERRKDVLVVEVRAGRVLEGLAVGGSIAVNGCCLTAVSVSPAGFVCELTEETLRRTAFDERLRPGVRVNLERPMRASGRFDGHIVQGHVDGLGTVRELRRLGDSAELLVAPPPSLERYLVEKGSVAIDGVSLTVASLAPGFFTIALIPYTLSETNLGDRQPGDKVSLEADVIAKYVERLLAQRDR